MHNYLYHRARTKLETFVIISYYLQIILLPCIEHFHRKHFIIGGVDSVYHLKGAGVGNML